MAKEGIPSETKENKILRLETRIDELERLLKHERECGRALPDYQEETICQIRKLFPVKSAKYPDSEIARVYSMYCEENHAAGWTETDLLAFGRYAFHGAIK